MVLAFIKMTKSEGSSNHHNNVFDSVDFERFLHQKVVVQSVDSLNGFLESGDLSLLKTKESSVNSFLSKDWETKPSSTKHLHVSTEEMYSAAAENPNATKIVASFAYSPISKDIQQSQDWIKNNTLGKHVEIPYSMGIFSSTVRSKNQTKTLLSIAPLMTQIQREPVTASLKSNVASAVKGTEKKKRKRAPRKKIVPQNKKFLEPTEKDVLMGRGGKSNHHPGNTRYRAKIDRLEDQYKKTNDKDEKTKISEALVLHVQSYGGNFLEKDDNGWYVIDDAVARRKVSQALREDKDPEKRRAKRQRFLKRRSTLEDSARRKKN